jgi:hypothetical protein
MPETVGEQDQVFRLCRSALCVLTRVVFHPISQFAPIHPNLHRSYLYPILYDTHCLETQLTTIFSSDSYHHSEFVHNLSTYIHKRSSDLYVALYPKPFSSQTHLTNQRPIKIPSFYKTRTTNRMSNLIATKRVDLLAPYLELDQGEKVQAECKFLFLNEVGGALLRAPWVGGRGWMIISIVQSSGQFCLTKPALPLHTSVHATQAHPIHFTSSKIDLADLQTSGLTEMEACDQKPKLCPRPPPVSTS